MLNLFLLLEVEIFFGVTPVKEFFRIRGNIMIFFMGFLSLNTNLSLLLTDSIRRMYSCRRMMVKLDYLPVGWEEVTLRDPLYGPIVSNHRVMNDSLSEWPYFSLNSSQYPYVGIDGFLLYKSYKKAWCSTENPFFEPTPFFPCPLWHLGITDNPALCKFIAQWAKWGEMPAAFASMQTVHFPSFSRRVS